MIQKIKILFCSLVLISCSIKESVKILPGLGVVLNNDSMLIGNTKSAKLSTVLNIPDTSIIMGINSCGYDYEGNEFGISYQLRIICYNGLRFIFTGPREDSLFLTTIRINPNKQKNLILNGKKITETSLELGEKYQVLAFDEDYTDESSCKDGLLLQKDSTGTKIKEISIRRK